MNTAEDHTTRAAAYDRGVHALEDDADFDRSREKKALEHYFDRIDLEFPGDQNIELRREGYELAINYAIENIGRADGSMFGSATTSLIGELRLRQAPRMTASASA